MKENPLMETFNTRNMNAINDGRYAIYISYAKSNVPLDYKDGF